MAAIFFGRITDHMPRTKYVPNQTPVENKIFLNTAEIAKLLGITPHTACTLVRTGAIKSSFIGRSYLVKRSDVDAFIERKAQVAASKRKAA